MFIKSFFIVCTIIASGLSLAGGETFKLYENQLYLEKNGQKKVFTVSEFRKRRSDTVLNSKFKNRYGLSLLSYFKSKKSLESTDKVTLDLARQINNFPKLNLMSNEYFKSTCENEMKMKEPGNIDGRLARLEERERKKRVKKCKDTTSEIVNSRKNSENKKFENAISKTKSQIEILKSEYTSRMTEGDKLIFTTDVDYLDFSGASLSKKQSCQISIPDSSSLDRYRDFFPLDGSAASFDTLRKYPPLEAFKVDIAESEVACSTNRSLNEGFKNLSTSIQEESELLTILQGDVFCSIHANSDLSQENIKKALEKIKGISSSNELIKNSLILYLENLNDISQSKPSRDDYANILWEKMFDDMNKDCSLKNRRTTQEMSSSFRKVLKAFYISQCEKSRTSPPSNACKVKAIEFGIDSAKNLFKLEKKLEKENNEKNIWNAKAERCRNGQYNSCNKERYDTSGLGQCLKR